jgi:hypothetical protein
MADEPRTDSPDGQTTRPQPSKLWRRIRLLVLLGLLTAALVSAAVSPRLAKTFGMYILRNAAPEPIAPDDRTQPTAPPAERPAPVAEPTPPREPAVEAFPLLQEPDPPADPAPVAEPDPLASDDPVEAMAEFYVNLASAAPPAVTFGAVTEMPSPASPSAQEPDWPYEMAIVDAPADPPAADPTQAPQAQPGSEQVPPPPADGPPADKALADAPTVENGPIGPRTSNTPDPIPAPAREPSRPPVAQYAPASDTPPRPTTSCSLGPHRPDLHMLVDQPRAMILVWLTGQTGDRPLPLEVSQRYLKAELTLHRDPPNDPIRGFCRLRPSESVAWDVPVRSPGVLCTKLRPGLLDRTRAIELWIPELSLPERTFWHVGTLCPQALPSDRPASSSSSSDD